MKPHRAFGVVTAVVVGACMAALLTPQQNVSSSSLAVAADGWPTTVLLERR